MRALITGAGGQLGRALIAAAPDAVTPIALDRAALDVRDADAVARALGKARPDVVFNAAAYTAVDAAETDADASFALNRDAVTILVHAAARIGAHLVHVSTDSSSTARAPLPIRPTPRPRRSASTAARKPRARRSPSRLMAPSWCGPHGFMRRRVGISC